MNCSNKIINIEGKKYQLVEHNPKPEISLAESLLEKTGYKEDEVYSLILEYLDFIKELDKYSDTISLEIYPGITLIVDIYYESSLEYLQANNIRFKCSNKDLAKILECSDIIYEIVENCSLFKNHPSVKNLNNMISEDRKWDNFWNDWFDNYGPRSLIEIFDFDISFPNHLDWR